MDYEIGYAGGTRPSSSLKVNAPATVMAGLVAGFPVRTTFIKLNFGITIANEFGVQPGGAVSPGNPDVPTYGQVFPSGR